MFYAGAAICIAVAWQATSGLYGLWRSRAEQRYQSDLDAIAFREEIHVAAESARARLANQLAWEGRKPLRVAAVVDESPDVKSIFLTDPEGRVLPRFLPGQYLTLTVPAGSGGEEVVRCYSLSDRPRTEYYRLSIRRQDAPNTDSDLPPGVVSTWLHRHARAGLEILCEAPKGSFFYNPGEPRPAVLIGAGVGVTPLISMLHAITHAGLETPIHAFFGFRDRQSHLFADELQELKANNPHLTTHITYSRPIAGDKLGVDYDSVGRVTLDWIRTRLPSSNFHYFLCGPAEMMQTLVPDLLAWGVPDSVVHFEAFGPASVNTKSGASLLEKAIGSEIRFSPDGNPLTWKESCDSLLDLAEQAGVPVAAGCRAGNCGSCRVRVLNGKVNTLRKPGVALQQDECLACISVPEGEVVLDT